MSLDRAAPDIDRGAPAASTRHSGIAALGAVAGGIASMSCCVMPLTFVLAGISGAWIANLTALSPYQPAFIALALVAIGYGHVTAYRARKACAAGASCARPLPRRLVDTGCGRARSWSRSPWPPTSSCRCPEPMP